LKRPDLALLALGGVVVAALAFGAWSGFPVLNDAYMVGLIREFGPKSILPDHPDQPLYGILLQGLATAFGWNRAPYVAIGVGAWALLAWQAMRLWTRLFPEERGLGSLAALLVVSPILVETQYSTATAILRANLPVSLCLAALLVGLGSTEQPTTWRLALSALLALIAASMTEYGLGTTIASVAFLAVLRRFRAAAALLAGGVAGYLAFRATANVQTDQYVDPSYLLPRVLDHPGVAVGRWITGIWHSLFGAWLSAAGGLRIDPTSRSILLAVAVGLFAAIALTPVWRRLRDSGEPRAPARSLMALVIAVMAGVVPIVLANRAANLPASDSRHRTHLLVFAAIFVVAFSSRLTARPFRPAVFAFLAFLAGYQVVDGALATRRNQRLLESVGAHLLPLVKSSPGVTVGVLPGQIVRTDLTPKATIHWSDEESKRAWVLIPDKAEDLFGSRARCHDTDRIDTPRELHTTGRHGPVSHLVWVNVRGDSVENLEPYCIQTPASRPPPGSGYGP